MSCATTLLLIAAAVLVFIVPLGVEVVIAVSDISLPAIRLVIGIMIGVGVLTEAGVTWWRGRLEHREIRGRVESELRTQQGILYRRHIRNILGQAVANLSVPVNARAALYLMNRNTGELKAVLHHNMEGAADQELTFESREGWVGHVWATGELLTDDFNRYNQAQAYQTYKLNPTKYELIRQAGVRAFLCAPVIDPLTSTSSVIGVFCTDTTNPLSRTSFEKEDLEITARVISATLGRFVQLGRVG